MSDKGSVFQKGGGGTNFEQSVQTAFLTTLIIRGNAPSIPANEIIEVAFQTTNRDYETDDLLVIAKSAIGQHRLLAQIKHNLTFSKKNNTFHEVIEAFWKDFNNSLIFDKVKDKLLIIKSGLNKDERNHIKSLLNWAKTHATEADFIAEVERINAKKERLEIFRESLKKANDDKDPSDKELWEFLKCLDVLEYDFLNESSISETYFLNLIRLASNNTTSANEKEIWDSIYVYVSKLNKDGGSVTVESIQTQELYKHFDASKINPYYKSIDKLQNDSEVILKPLKSTIGDFHLPRESTYESIITSINNFDFTIVTGIPGVGKSAAVKTVLQRNYGNASVFVFRADQFNSPHLANVFASQGVQETLQDIFSCLSLIPEKAIVIDSLEKLLEGDPDNAFKQLLALLKEYPDIKIIATARRYSIDLIFQKFGIDPNGLGIVEVPPLDENELQTVEEEFPQLKSVLKNKKIKKLLESPKYLDFAVSALKKVNEDFTKISLKGFKEKLWSVLVKDAANRTGGYPAKREDAFLNIAVKRAREMKLFVKPDQADEAAIDLLENDEIIFQENENRRYSPAHDILEDWALVKYVSSTFEDNPTPKDLFSELGNEPAIRRAFRLWVEDELIDDGNSIIDLIRTTISDSTIERYWADELFTAIFKSDDCSSFFKEFEKDLLYDNAKLLNRCIHLVRTTCKESNLGDNNFSLLLPVGSGWPELLAFLNSHKSQLDNIRLSVANLLLDWEYRLLFQKSVGEAEQLNVKEILIYYINQIEAGDEFWDEDSAKYRSTGLISLLYNLSHISKQEITSLIERSLKAKEERENWRLRSFYEKIIEKCLSGLDTQRLTRELPELVVQTAWREWKLPIPEESPDREDRLEILRGSRLRNDECWGIRDKHSFFPSGIYKTPFLNVLYAHPVNGLKFITEFINYAVDFYVSAECDYKHEITQIELELNDGTPIKQWAAWELWAAYRGSSVTHYAIESLLMSLEKYLLKTAERKTDVSRKNLQLMFNYLLRNSNNVAITSVLASVSIAFPEEVGDEMLPILGVREFYSWDLSRSMQEHSVLAPMDNEIPFAQKERSDSNQLPHRRKYMRGLSDFILDYQFNIRALNSQIHQVFDKLKAQIPKDDVIWKKVMTEMDIRNHKVGEFDEKLGGFPIQPEYDTEVTEFMSSNEESFKAESVSLNYSGQLKKAFDGVEPITFAIWKQCFDQYSNQDQINPLYDRPVTLAVIGLRDFPKELKKKQKTWSIRTIKEAIVTILKDEFNRNYDLNRSINLMEKEIALSSYHYLFDHISDKSEKTDIITIMIYMLFAPFAEHEVDKMIVYIRNVFFKRHPDIGKRIWIGLIKYAKFRKSNPYYYDHHNQEKLKAVKAKEQNFITELASTDDLNLSVDEIDLENHDGYFLARAFAITPYDSEEYIFSEFISHFIPLLTEDLKIEEDYSYHRNRASRQINFESTFDAQQYLTDLLLKADIEQSKQVMDLILDPIYSADFVPNRANKDLFEFSSKIPEYVIYKLDEIIANSEDEAINSLLIENFWKVWEYFFEKIKSSGKQYLTPILLLDIKWKTESSHWQVLESKRDFYHTMVQEFGGSNTKALINVFSTAGEKTFLPVGLTWIVDILKNDKTGLEISSLITQSAERLVKRLFYNHISAIKKNKKLIDDFIWLLDKMVDLGSSQAYMFRENVITYKSDTAVRTESNIAE